MKGSLVEKILKAHLLKGNLQEGEIQIKIDQTLTQDSTGTMAYLQLEAMDIGPVATERSVAYIDHNMLQQGFENADDHAFIKSCCDKHGILYSKPGGGICHQVHLERFAIPGKTLLGSDSHTPTAGGLGSIAIGAGGLDVAVAMAKGFYYLPVPKVYFIELVGKPKDYINGKDIILTVLEKLSVKGGVGYIMEYGGEGIDHLSVTDRATICNMGAELGATSSIFPSDERTKEFLKAQGREKDYLPLQADEDAVYDKKLQIDLSTIEAKLAGPHSPDNVEEVENLVGMKVDQVCIGSCTNSSYMDLMRVSKILKGKKVHPDTSLVISPGSANILHLMAENGALATFISAGARILEAGCGPCIGMGQAPKGGGVSLRTFNRNFKGRSGTMDAKVYLVSPETAAMSAIAGTVQTAKGWSFDIEEPLDYGKNDGYFVEPRFQDKIEMGKNIKPFPIVKPLEDQIDKKCILKVGDNITTDDICPSNAKLLPYRSNIPYLSKFSFTTIVDDFSERAKKDGGIIVAGENYGQGSSREHAALIPLFLGIKAVIAKSFARIHRQNLINNGILPLVFKNKKDYDKVEEGDQIHLVKVKEIIKNGGELLCQLPEKGEEITLIFDGSCREREILEFGGYLNYAKKKG
ncbi:MAG: aconitate hydratase [Tissierellia bacterium]|nr:aconitate hydratase [Tissierellia bacterium]